MLSKDEILKKKGRSPEQLDLVKDLDANNSKTKNRLLLILIMFLFVGSSTSLWFYREYRAGNLIFNFSLPKFSPNISVDDNSWQVCLFDNQSKSIIYNKNCTITNIPSVTVKNNINLIKSSLPNGLIIDEQISSSSNEINYLSNITSPQFSFLLTIKIFGSYPLDISQNLIPKLASDLYWKYSQK